MGFITRRGGTFRIAFQAGAVPQPSSHVLGCVASAASSERSEVVSALRTCISTQTASDPLVAGEKGLTHSLSSFSRVNSG